MISLRSLLCNPVLDAVALHTAERVRFFVEAGLLEGWFQYRDEPPKYPNDGVALGGYGLLAVTFIIR